MRQMIWICNKAEEINGRFEWRAFYLTFHSAHSYQALLDKATILENKNQIEKRKRKNNHHKNFNSGPPQKIVANDKDNGW
jgi:hypothetical protein